MKRIFVLVCVLMLTGCSGGRDLENRDFVMAVGAEEEQNTVTVYTSIAKLSSKGEDTGSEEILYEGRGNDISSALKDLNTKTAGEIYMGHTKALVLDSDFTQYDRLIDYIKGNVEMGRDIVVVKSDDVKSILEAKPDSMTVSAYIYKYFEDKEKVDVDSLIDSFNYNTSLNIPKARVQEEKILFDL